MEKKGFLNSAFMSELSWFKFLWKLGRFVLFLFKFSGIFAWSFVNFAKKTLKVDNKNTKNFIFRDKKFFF